MSSTYVGPYILRMPLPKRPYTFATIDAEYLARLMEASFKLEMDAPYDFIPFVTALRTIVSSLKCGDLERAHRAYAQFRPVTVKGGPAESLATDAERDRRIKLAAHGRKGGLVRGGKKAAAARRNGTRPKLKERIRTS